MKTQHIKFFNGLLYVLLALSVAAACVLLGAFLAHKGIITKDHLGL